MRLITKGMTLFVALLAFSLCGCKPRVVKRKRTCAIVIATPDGVATKWNGISTRTRIFIFDGIESHVLQDGEGIRSENNQLSILGIPVTDFKGNSISTFPRSWTLHEKFVINGDRIDVLFISICEKTAVRPKLSDYDISQFRRVEFNVVETMKLDQILSFTVQPTNTPANPDAK